MNMPGPIREITSRARRAKSQANRAENRLNRSRGSGKRAGGSKPKRESNPKSTSGPEPKRESKLDAVLPAVAGVVGAIVAVLLGLAIADNADDRLLFALIGLPLGAILAIGVVTSYRWAGLIDQPD